MFQVVLHELFVTVLFPPRQHEWLATIPFLHLLTNGVFFLRKLLASRFFSFRQF